MSNNGMPLDPKNSINKPSAARVYDYFIGGKTNYAIDRAFATNIEQVIPNIAQYAITCRQFLTRAVEHCSRVGIRQYIDIGAGLPIVGDTVKMPVQVRNVHEIADEVRPQRDTRVVYVDNEPIALAHAEVLLAETADPTRHHAVSSDLLQPEDLWARVRRTGLIDVNEPVALVLNALMHFVKDDDDPDTVLEFYRRKLPPGSFLIMASMTNENPESEEEAQALEQLVAFYEKTTNPGQLRTLDELVRFFGDWEVEEPGLVYAPGWHPDGANIMFSARPSRSRILAGIARKSAQS